MAETDQERTEQATPRRRQDARESGNIARSQDLTAAVVLLIGILLLNWFGLYIFNGMRVMVEVMLGGGLTRNATRPEDLMALLSFALRMSVLILAPLSMAIAASALVAVVAQVGLNFTLKPLQPSLNKLSPGRGLKQMGDARAMMRLVMSLAKTIVLVTVAGWVIWTDMPRILTAAELALLPLLAASCQLMFDLGLKLAAALLILAILDFAFQRWQHSRDLRMTKQEVKEELKRMDGDPQIKQRRARVARQLAMQRVGQAVPNADVVVTNPTHFAVALQYDAQTMQAPKVVAKGADLLAMRIRQIAAANGVPIVERKELARALFANVEPGQQVPPQFYGAVAEILAYVYRLSGRRSA